MPEAKKAVKALAAESGLSKDISKAKSKLLDEDFPALNSPKPPAATPVIPPKAAASKATSSKKSPDKSTDKAKEKAKDKGKEKEKSAPAATPTPAPEKTEIPKLPKLETKALEKGPDKVLEKAADKKAEKRPVPGILNIAAATKAAQVKNLEAQSAVDKATAERDSAFPALPLPTPVSASSPLARAAPKTLRVVSTPRTEAPSTPILATPAVRSVAASIRPETPASELISDSASIISASISASRTNSPPPSKIGSAPVRTTTKSQQRKQRKEALKKESATIAAQPVKVETTVEIAPILGRKKKQKKEKEKSSSKAATPSVSRPETPLATHPAPVKEAKEAPEVKEVREESSAYRSTANETTTLTDEPLHKGRYSDVKGKASDRHDRSSEASTPRTLPTPASVLHDLQASGMAPDNLESLAFFKSVSVQLDKSRNDSNGAGLRDQAAKNSMTPTKSIVTEDDQASLLAGKPVRKVMDGTRILLTPNGDCIRNLHPDEEDRFLELQQLVAEATASPAAFVSSRHEAGSGFSLIKGRAVPNGPPSYFPPAPGAYPSDPVNKIQREEAIYYINQYVLPRLNLNARDMSLPKAMSTWTTDPRGSAAQAAAANLSSVAPWLYGGIGNPASHLPPMSHDDMLDAGAAPPELSYPGPVGAFADDMHHHGGPHGAYVDINSQLPTVEEVFGPHSGPSPASTPRHHHHHHHHHHHQPHQHHHQPHQPSSATIASATIASAAGGINFTSPGPFGNVPLMSLEDAEQALSSARKETDKLEKSLSQLMRKNRRLLMASHHMPTAAAVAVGGGAGAGGGGGGH
jgi:CCR4-NOT transcription complex subunit 4